MVPGGIRIGTPALTTRGLVEKDFEKVADFVDKGIKLSIQANKVGDNAKKLSSFKKHVSENSSEIAELKKEVIAFASKFQMPY